MKFEDLDAKRDDYDLESWELYDALFRGGRSVRGVFSKLLTKNPFEEPERHQARIQDAAYLNYSGPIVNYFTSALFTSPPKTVPQNGEDGLDDFYDTFNRDCDRARTDVETFMRRRFAESMVYGESWWMVCLPEADIVPASALEWKQAGLGDAFLCTLSPERVVNVGRDAHGGLEWVLIHTVEPPEVGPRATRRTYLERWQLFDATDVETFQVEYEDAQSKPRNGDDIKSLGKMPHGFSKIPIVELRPADCCWVMDLIADPQRKHFQLDAALSWTMKLTCYPMPVLSQEVPEDPTMGAGYFIRIGQNDKVEWVSPDTSPYTVIAERLAAIKDEIYRVTNQMALGVENNAAAVGRSAESKSADAASTETVLQAMAKPLREALEVTFDIIADGRGEDITWDVQGLNKFKLSDPTSALDNATVAKALSVPSKTFKVELYKQVVGAMMPLLSKEQRDLIGEEIEDGVEHEEELAELMDLPVDDADPDEKLESDLGASTDVP